MGWDQLARIGWGAMKTAIADVSSVTPAASAPAWVPVVSQVNEILTLISLVIAIGLALGRAVYWLKRKRHD